MPPRCAGLVSVHRRSSACGRQFWWAGTLAAAAGNGLIGGSFPLVTVFSEAVAGGAVLALVTHAMIPEAIEEAGSLIVLPTTAGFLAALYLALAEHSV